MKYQTMPPLSEDDAIALEKSIRTHGIQVPVLMDDEGAIIDGHHRWEIANRYSLPCPTRVAEGLDEGQKVALSISLNVDRRQLTRQQKREVIEASLKAQPEASNREHARRTGVDDKTVATVRGALESTAEIPQLDKTRGADGRERTTQPAAKPAPVVSISTKEAVDTAEAFDAQTGEVIDVATAMEAVERSSSMQDARYVTEFTRALGAAGRVWQFDAGRVGMNADSDVLITLRQFADQFEKFAKRVERVARGLRIVDGGK